MTRQHPLAKDAKLQYCLAGTANRVWMLRPHGTETMPKPQTCRSLHEKGQTSYGVVLAEYTSRMASEGHSSRPWRTDGITPALTSGWRCARVRPWQGLFGATEMQKPGGAGLGVYARPFSCAMPCHLMRSCARLCCAMLCCFGCGVVVESRPLVPDAKTVPSPTFCYTAQESYVSALVSYVLGINIISYVSTGSYA